MHAVMASVHSKGDDVAGNDVAAGAGTAYAPTIRLTGIALMSEVKVVVRRREDPVSEEESD